jgi:hypothetical protein
MEHNKQKTVKRHVRKQMPSLVINNEKIKDPVTVADVFTTSFLQLLKV